MDNPNDGLIDRINEKDAKEAGITRLFLWEQIKSGIDTEEGSVRYNYTKLAAEFLGMKLAEQIRHSGSVGIVPQLSDQDRADLRRSIEAEMRQAIPASHGENEDE